MFYKIQLVPLIDEDDLPFNYYNLKPCNNDDMERPWEQGVRFRSPPTEKLSLEIDLDDPDAGAFSDYIYGPIPLVTERLKLVLDSCGISNIDYYLVEVAGADKFDSFPKYYALNVIGKVAAADPGKSEYSEAFGQMGATLFSKFVLNNDAVRNLDLFRLAEQSFNIVVSEKIKLACQQAGIDTLRFIPLEEAN